MKKYNVKIFDTSGRLVDKCPIHVDQKIEKLIITKENQRDPYFNVFGKLCLKKSLIMKPTEEQFNQYRRVQFQGSFNMFDPQARLSTGLDKDVYIQCMEKYEELEQEYGSYSD